MKNKINIVCIVVFIIGILAAFIFGASTDTVKVDLPDAETIVVIEEGDTVVIEDETVTLESYMKSGEPKHIHCDYCEGYIYSPYNIDLEIPGIWVFSSDDTDRIICQNCLLRAYIKGLDKILGSPKYLKKRPKELRRE